MTLRQFISLWLEANREYVRRQLVSRAVNNQTAFRISELYRATHEQFDPLFVLSTGRTGTKLLTKIFNAHPAIQAFHEPFPEPYYHSAYAYRHHKERPGELRMMIDCARYGLIRDTFLTGKKYVETNNKLTFFAHPLAELYPKSRFVHLVRKPTAFVQSGCSRGWYSDRVITDEGRIQPRDGDHAAWADYSQVKKIAWLWNETNRFIEEFKATLPGDRMLTIQSEALYRDPAAPRAVFELLGIESLPENTLKRLLKRPVNRQRPSSIRKLTSEQQAEVVALTPLARTYYG
jgi:hypothetical protein